MTNYHQIRVLVCGDVEGQFGPFISKIGNVVKKAGPFECLFCLGEFFGQNAEENRKFLSGGYPKLPLQTYILGTASPTSVAYFEGTGLKQLEKVERLTYLGGKGYMNLASELSVVYLSGLESSTITDYSFSKPCIDELIQSVVNSAGWSFGIDLLLTCQWPSSVDCYNSTPGPPESSLVPSSSAQISLLATMLKPRYHFCALSGHYFERQPYRNHRVLQDPSVQVTRFIGLARFGNVRKSKAIYAFSIVPARFLDRPKLVEQPGDTTEPPYGRLLAELAEAASITTASKPSSEQYFYDPSAKMDEGGSRGRRKKHRGGPRNDSDRHYEPKPKKPFELTDACWFCLQSPEVEKHLLVSVGASVYMALPKGGLTPDSTLILPITHIQSVAAASGTIIDEVERFKTALRNMFAASGKHMVCFERNFKTAHFQIQVVPLPVSLTPKLILETFMESADARGVELTEVPTEMSVSDLVNPGIPYFWAELPSDSGSSDVRKLFYKISKNNFPLTFGRDILASSRLLKIPDRINWRSCVLSKEEETRMAETFRKAFGSYDIVSDANDEDDDDDDDDDDSDSGGTDRNSDGNDNG